jgi:hypothetical protein
MIKNPDLAEAERRKEEERIKEREAKKKEKAEKNLVKKQKADEIMKTINTLPKDILLKIMSKLPKNTQDKIEHLSNESKEKKYFLFKSQSAKDRFFQKQKPIVQQEIRKREFEKWRTEMENREFQGGKVIKKILKDLITRPNFDREEFKSVEYVKLTFENDDELQDIVEKYKNRFQEFIKPYPFKLFIYKYLTLKYGKYLIEHYRRITPSMHKVAVDIEKEIRQEYKDDKEKMNEIIFNLVEEYDDDIGTIWSIQQFYAVSLRPKFFHPQIWSRVQEKLNLKQSPAPSSAASSLEHSYDSSYDSY